MELIHTAYRVDDLEGSRAFYEALGFEMCGRYQFEDSIYLFLGLPAEIANATPGDPTRGARLELIYRAPWRHAEVGPGFDHVGVAVEDLDAALERLAAWDLRLDRPPHVPPSARVCFVSDPAGRVVELIER